MSRSGSSPFALVRACTWGLLLFAAVAWLVIGWSVLRLEPSDLARVAGAMILFGALAEAVRACAGTRMWWLNAGLAVLFAATGVVVLTGPDSSFPTAAALVGWYLLVRGAADIAVATLTRESDRIWGLLMVVGLLEVGLGFFAASPLSRTADLVVTTLGAVGVLRAVADLVTALRIREVRAALPEAVEVPVDRVAEAGAAPERGGPRHRAASRPVPALPAVADESLWLGGPATTVQAAAARGATAGYPAAGAGGTTSGPAGMATATADLAGAGTTTAGRGLGGPAAGQGGAGGTTADVGARRAAAYPDEVFRSTADLDAMLALSGMPGAGVGALLHVYEVAAPVDEAGLAADAGRADAAEALRNVVVAETDVELPVVAGSRRSD